MRLSGMRDYYIIRYAINSDSTHTPVPSISSFSSDYTEYQNCFGTFPCIHRQMHDLRQEIGDYMQSILCNTGSKEGDGEKCRQKKYYHGFGRQK